MKKLSLLCAVLFALSFTACKKDYTCTCTALGVDTVSPLDNTSKSDAEDACSALETTAQAIDSTATCVLN